jgi:hypothetical protein
MRIKFVIFFLLFTFSCSFAEKTDIVILKNGDRLTGKIKLLHAAVLTFKTDAMGTVSIKWEDIKFIKSKYSFRVERESGVNSFGIISADTLNNELIVGVEPYWDKIKMDKVVYLVPVHKTFYDAISISTDIGFSYTKASNVLQLNFSGEGNYTTKKYQRSFDFSSIVTAQKDTTQSQNHNYKFQVIRFLKKKWFLTGGTGAQKNTELGLDLRLYLSGGGGRDIIRTNSNILNAAIGTQVTREWANGITDAKNSIEGILSVQYSQFRLSTPKLNWLTTINTYPSLTTKERYRIEFNSDLKWEVIKHLFWKLSFFDNYDSKPESGESHNNDYGVTISLGWTHN